MMYTHTLDPAILSWFSSPGFTSAPNLSGTQSHSPLPRIFYCRAKQLSEASSSDQRRQQKELSRILRTEAAVRNVEMKASSKKNSQLWPKAVIKALDEAVRENNWKAALKIFGLLRKQRWYEANCRTYAKLLMMLGRCGQPEQATLLFESILSDGLQPTIDVYTALVSAYGQSGLLDNAFQTLNDMKAVSDCVPDAHTYSVLIKSCTKFREFDMVHRILAEMAYMGVEPNTVTYNIIIDGYGKAELYEKMERTLADMMENSTCPPDIFTFNSVISAYGNSGQIEKMEKWYDEFQLTGLNPDVQSFNILIRSYGKAAMYEKMESVLDFMQKRCHSPTVVTYNIVIEAFGKSGNINKMDIAFQKMKHEGMKPNRITYCSLVSAYGKAGRLDKVDSIIRQVDNSDVVLDTPFFNCVISAYGQAGNVEKMAQLLLEMKERDCEPDNITFATMIQAYNAWGMTESARNLEKRMLTPKHIAGIELIGC